MNDNMSKIEAIARVVEQQGELLEQLAKTLSQPSAVSAKPVMPHPVQPVALFERILEKPLSPEQFAQITAVLAGPDKAHEQAASMLVLHKMEEWAPKFLAAMEAQRLRAQGNPEIQRLREEVEIRRLRAELDGDKAGVYRRAGVPAEVAEAIASVERRNNGH